jgi:hypothetical protein
VLGGGFDLWLGDNISILSMVKRAHPLLSNSTIYLIVKEDSLSTKNKLHVGNISCMPIIMTTHNHYLSHSTTHLSHNKNELFLTCTIKSTCCEYGINWLQVNSIHNIFVLYMKRIAPPEVVDSLYHSLQ